MTEIERCVVLAGGTGGAKLAAGMQDLLGDGPVGDRQHRRRRRGARAWTSPPTPTWSPTGSPDRDRRGAGLGDQGRHLRPSSSAWSSSARPTGSSSPTATSPPASTGATFIAEGGTPHRRPGPDRPRPRRRARQVLPMCEQPVRTRVRTAAGLARPAGVPDRRPRRAARSRRSRWRGSPRPRRPPRSLAAIAGGRRDRDRPLQPRDLDRPDPRDAGHARGDRRLAARPSSPSARTSRASVVKGPTDAFMQAIGRPPPPPGSPRSTRACSTEWSATRAIPIRRRRASTSHAAVQR